MQRLRGWFKPESDAGVITVVSGLPRSGTSMMMQMLQAGGMPVLIDDHRQPDASNPAGYYEYALVKRLHKGDNGWLNQAQGKAVKVISALLTHLPPTQRYRVLLMDRDLDEIIRSQQVMRQRLASETGAFDAAAMQTEFSTHLDSVKAWLASQSHIQTLHIAYADVIAQPDQPYLYP